MKKIYKSFIVITCLILAFVAVALVGCNKDEKATALTADMITLSDSSLAFTGAELKPTVTVKNGDTTIEAKEYSVTYSNNKNKGTATVTVTAAKDSTVLSGSATKNFDITAVAAAAADFSVTVANDSVTEGTGAKQAPVVKNTKLNYTLAASEYTVKYVNATGTEITTDAGFTAGEVTVKVSVKKDGNFTFEGDSLALTDKKYNITAASQTSTNFFTAPTTAVKLGNQSFSNSSDIKIEKGTGNVYKITGTASEFTADQATAFGGVQEGDKFIVIKIDNADKAKVSIGWSGTATFPTSGSKEVSDNEIILWVNRTNQPKFFCVKVGSDSYFLDISALELITTTTVKSETELRNALAKDGDIVLSTDITAAAQFAVTKKNTIDLNGHKITETITWNGSSDKRNQQALFDLNAATADLTITDNSTGANGSVVSDDLYLFRVGTDGTSGVSAKLNIQKGKYVADLTIVQVTRGTATIEGGEFSISPANGTYGTRYLLNCIDANYGTTTANRKANIIVKGGKFTGYDPMNSHSDEGTTGVVSFLADGLYTDEEDGVYTVATKDEANNAYVDSENTLSSALTNGTKVNIVLVKDITMANSIRITATKTIDLNGHNIAGTDTNTSAAHLFIVTSGNLTVKGNGNVSSAAHYIFQVGTYSTGSSGTDAIGTLLIEGGTYTTPAASVVYVGKGNATITGGDFTTTWKNSGNSIVTKYLLNCYDANYINRSASITVKGGTFHNFNPQAYDTEGAHTDFVAPEYTSSEVVANSGIYEVKEIPTISTITITSTSAADALKKAINGESSNGETKLADARIILEADVTGISETLKIDKGRHVILDLNGHSIAAQDGAITSVAVLFYVRYGKLTIIDSSSDKDGSIDSNNNITFAMGTTAETNPERGSLNINVADTVTFSSDYEVVYVACGTARISGGTFKYNADSADNDKRFLLNRRDGKERALIELTGGKYEGFNPGSVTADPKVSNNNVSYVKEGYEAKADGSNGNYTVSKKAN